MRTSRLAIVVAAPLLLLTLGPTGTVRAREARAQTDETAAARQDQSEPGAVGESMTAERAASETVASIMKRDALLPRGAQKLVAK